MDLVKYNSVGFVPGPAETEEEYQKRIDYCLELKNHFPELSFSEETAVLQPGLQETKRLYDIYPDWVPLFFSNTGLWLWHAGSSWIFQKEKGSPLGALLQLRKSFYKRSSFLFYHRDEIVAHELCHIGRMAFEEKQFEELLAYRTSKRFFPRYFGPILQSVGESRLFMIVLFTLLLMDLFLLFMGALDSYFQLFYLKLIPVLMVAFAGMRLWKRHRVIRQAEENLKGVWNEPAFILYRLTDSEIEEFSRLGSDQIREYAEGNDSLRWRAIKAVYSMRGL